MTRIFKIQNVVLELILQKGFCKCFFLIQPALPGLCANVLEYFLAQRARPWDKSKTLGFNLVFYTENN